MHHFRFENVCKRFDPPKGSKKAGVAAVNNVSFGLKKGEIVSLIGPSGCGKSTLLSVGAGLSRCTSGAAYIGDDLISGPRPEVAFMLQKDLLLPWRTVLKNIELGLEIRHCPKEERKERAKALLHQCKLGDFGDYLPHQISGGMRQRAALARTLAVDPDVLLLDEPFSALDAQTKLILRGDLARMLQEHGKTTLLITHDITEALSLSDRVMVMSHRPGTILSEIDVDLPDRGDPFKRSLHPRVNSYTAEIWSMLAVPV